MYTNFVSLFLKGVKKMKATGIVVEYNPFHNGHMYHAKKAREKTNADVIIAVMSGSFLQRGLPALVSKWERTEMALSHGVDLVFELPYAYACQKADIFAQGAVSMLASLFVDSLCFGSEVGEIEPFIQAANILLNEEEQRKKTIETYLKKGLNYPTAFAKSLSSYSLSLDITKPNNILGLQYVKSIISNHYNIQPVTIQRTTSYHETKIKEKVTSATSIKNHLLHGHPVSSIAHTMPQKTVELLQKHEEKMQFISWEHLFPFLKYRIRTSSKQELAQIHEAEEGLEHRIYSMIHQFSTFESFMNAFKTKRYTQNRLQRFCTHILTHTTKEELHSLPSETPYLRLLGMNLTGRQYLNQIKKEVAVPIITKRTAHHDSLLDIEDRAHFTYSMGFPKMYQPSIYEMEFKRAPVIILT